MVTERGRKNDELGYLTVVLTKLMCPTERREE
jgi:hypothetical protein